MTISSKKAQHTAVLALCLSGVFFIATLLLGAYWQALAVYALSWQILAGAMVWGVLVVQFYHRAMAEQEKLDMARMSKSLQQETIFSGGGDRIALFEQAQKRQAFFEKWLLPSAGVIIAVIEIVLGLLLYKRVSGIQEWKFQNPLLCAVLMMLISFVSFLISRYATGMSGETVWRPLRAGGSYFLTTAFLGFLTAIALAFAQFKYPIGLTLLEYGIPWLLVVLGCEILLNTLLDIYRPRMAGQYSQSAFDSRLLGLVNEPGGLFHTIAGAIDYQFGFQASQTWFYKLLEKAILPLVLFTVAMLYLMTSVVIVGPGQMGVIEHLGSPDPQQGGKQVGPGLTFKWPWPFDQLYLYPTDSVQQVNIGFVEEENDKNNTLLWGKEHYKQEYDLIVASANLSSNTQQDAVPVSLVRANVPVLYRIKDVSAYLYHHTDPQQTLEALCYRELTRFGAGATVETDENVIESSLLGRGRLEASRVLQQQIQKAADNAGLGVEIVLCGLQGIHPPPKLAEDYQNVIASVQSRQAAVLNAMAERNKTLTGLAGSIDEVNALYELVQKYSQVKDSLSAEQNLQMRQELASALKQTKGQVFRVIRQAEADAFEKATLAEATGQRFQGQLKAYRANPELYKRIERLKVLEDTLGKIRKYVVVADIKDTQVYIVDLQEKLTPSLYDMDVESVIQESNKK
jgi:modulator of FtsH protease HflK